MSYPTNPPFKPTKPFGLAVEKSGFARVCFKCNEKWSDYQLWMQQTEVVDQIFIKRVGTLNIREHKDCGGQMLSVRELGARIKPVATLEDVKEVFNNALVNGVAAVKPVGQVSLPSEKLGSSPAAASGEK